MKKENYKLIKINSSSKHWHETISIYNESFPEWEKEPVDIIKKRVDHKKYKMTSYIENNEVKGFYILDINKKNNFLLFTFLAVDKKYRGKGIGSLLCKNAIESFKKFENINWLFIEAEDRQAKLYIKLGFLKIKIDYFIPKYDSYKSIPMHLLVIQKNNLLTKNDLEFIIKRIFTYGYRLKEEDKRIYNVIHNLPKKISYTKDI